MVDVGQDNRSDPVALGGGLCQSEGGVLGSGVNSTLGESVFDVGLNLLLSSIGNDRSNIRVSLIGVTEFVAIAWY